MDDSQEFVGNWTTHWRIRKLLFVDFRTLKERQVLKRNVANVFSVKCRAENRSGLSRFSLRQFAFSRVFQFSNVSLLARIFFPAIPRNRWKQRWEGQGKAQRIKKTKKNIVNERRVERREGKRWARFGSEKGVGSRDERRWWTRLHLSIQTLGPAPAGSLLQSFSTSRPVSQLHLRVQTNLLFRSSCFSASYTFRSSLPLTFPSLPVSWSSRGRFLFVVLPTRRRFVRHLLHLFFQSSLHSMIRGPEKRESSGHSLLLLLFALDIPFTRDEPPRRQLISGQEVTSASLETDPSTPPTSSLQAQPRALLYRFADHREFEFSDSEMSRMILLWGFKRPSPPSLRYSETPTRA